jgi:uncharacterized membrane protein YphA (DoxX/SURF4 family)
MNTLFFSSLLIVIMFILAGYGKSLNIMGTANTLKDKVQFDLPFNLYIGAILIVIFLQVIGSLTILYSSLTDNARYYAYLSSLGLAGFTILASMIFHYPPIGAEYYNFTKNMAITGGLLLLSDRFKY